MSVRRFFCERESPQSLALVRIGLGLALGYDAARHWPYAIELYSSAGLPMPVFPGSVLDWWVPPAPVAVLVQTLAVFALLGMIIGWQTRLSIGLALVATTWFGLLDLPGTFAKYSAVAVHLLLLLGLSGCGAVWSIDAWVRNGRAQTSPLIPAWPRRLIQIFVCSVYLGAALTKLKLPEFASGDLLLHSLLDDHCGTEPCGLWLAARPDWLVLGSLATLLWELLFPFLVWFGRARVVMLGLAVAFHLTVELFLDLGVFSAVMLAALAAFLEEGDVQRVRHGLGRVFGHRGELLAPMRPEALLEIAGSSPPRSRPVSREVEWSEMSSDTSGACQAGELAARPTHEDRTAPRAHVDTAETRYSRRLRWAASAAAYLLALGAFCAAGFGIQYFGDWYGAFHSRPAEPFPELAAAEVAEMLAARRPPEQDYFQRVELGSRVNGLRVSGARRQFRRGMVVYVMLQLIQPHPPLSIEGLLIAPDGQEIARFSQSLDSAYDSAVRGFEMTPELPSGRYRILVQANGYEVAQKAFELLP